MGARGGAFPKRVRIVYGERDFWLEPYGRIHEAWGSMEARDASTAKKWTIKTLLDWTTAYFAEKRSGYPATRRGGRSWPTRWALTVFICI